MKRIAALLFAFGAWFAVQGAAAQLRTLPAESLRGNIRPVQDNIVSVDGRDLRLAPGATIRNRENRTIVSGALPPAGAAAAYLVDADGQISRVWLLTAEEAARPKRRP